MRERARVDARKLEEIVDEGTEPARVLVERREILLGLGEAVLDRLEHGGDRRHRRTESWLAAAMSSRRASKRLSSSDAIALNDRPSFASSRGPPVGARAVRSPSASRSEAALSSSRGRVIDAASTRATATALAAAPAATARIFTSAPMWNITHPDSSTAASGSTTASSPNAASCARTAGQPAQGDRSEQAERECREADGDCEMNQGTNL